MARKPVERLDQALRYWEQAMRVLRIDRNITRDTFEVRTDPNMPQPCHHSKEYRKHVMGIRDFANFDMARFTGLNDTKPETMHAEAIFPAALASWMTQSRRVYRIPEDLQFALLATSLKKLICNDIDWPFPAFGMELERPILYRNMRGQDIKFDFILVSRMPFRSLRLYNGGDTKDALYVVLLNQALGTWEPGQEALLAKAETAIARGELPPDKYFRKAPRLYKPHFFESIGLDLFHKGHLSVEEVVRQTTTSSAGQLIVRIVAGLCLYLSMLPSDSPHRGEWKPAAPKARTLDPTAITDVAEICSVSSTLALSGEERNFFREVYGTYRDSYELPVHFREAYWRRPKGFGHIPEHPQTEHVRWAWVNRLRLPEGALPEGRAVRL